MREQTAIEASPVDIEAAQSATQAQPAPSSKNRRPQSGSDRHISEAERREQALCRAALDAGKYDNLSDAEWIALCEQIARESKADEESE
jgi:hypothetical protein